MCFKTSGALSLFNQTKREFSFLFRSGMTQSYTALQGMMTSPDIIPERGG